MARRTQADVDVAPADEDEEEEGDIAAWARPAYASAYSDYLLSGARYGHSDEGMRRWMSEQIEQQRRKAGRRDGR
ncbi:MAG TPA: hypothetical protein VFN11_14295 [Ktedonobacterales bacterium]|nr:hypothetical protein [Ktedonobacterales bacterium]